MTAHSDEVEALSAILGALNSLDEEARDRVLRSVQAFYYSGPTTISSRVREIEPSARPSAFSDSDDASMTPKQFLTVKQPQTDVERIAALAYYLTHYRSLPHFKTTDLSQLNTEAAQIKFANAAQSAANAQAAGLLVPGTKGTRQISAAGEAYVRALPDRATARETLQARRRRTARRKKV